MTLARIAADAGEPLVVVLDAINERDETMLPANRIAGEWMPRTIEWLRRNNSKLIVTCRPETWPELAPLNLSDAVFPQPRAKQKDEQERRPPGISRPLQGGLWVGDLDADEISGTDQKLRSGSTDRHRRRAASIFPAVGR